jgi:hypothetical protein
LVDWKKSLQGRRFPSDDTVKSRSGSQFWKYWGKQKSLLQPTHGMDLLYNVFRALLSLRNFEWVTVGWLWTVTQKRLEGTKLVLVLRDCHICLENLRKFMKLSRSLHGIRNKPPFSQSVILLLHTILLGTTILDTNVHRINQTRCSFSLYHFDVCRKGSLILSAYPGTTPWQHVRHNAPHVLYLDITWRRVVSLRLRPINCGNCPSVTTGKKAGWTPKSVRL